MELEILKIIKKNLPEQTAGELKDFIEEAIRDKAALEKVSKDLLEKIEIVNKLLARESEFEKAKDLLEKANIQKGINEEKEKQMEVDTLKVQLEAQKVVSTNFQLFLANLTSNKEFSKSFFGNINANGYIGGQSFNVNGDVNANT